MIKIKSAVLATLALAAFGFVSCDHDYSNSEIQDGVPVTEYNATHASAADDDSEDLSITFDCTDTSTDIGAAMAAIGDTSSAASNFTAGTYDGITLTQTNDGDLQKPKTSLYCVQLKKNAATATFAVGTGATIKVYASSSGNEKTTSYNLSGAATGTASVTGSSDFTEKSFSSTSAGTVTISIPSGDDNNNLRIQKILVTY